MTTSSAAAAPPALATAGPVEGVTGRTVRGRPARQERSERTRQAIVEATAALIAERGVAPITHRLVAARSGALLAATTYYFETKQDLVAEASNQLLRGYLADFAAVAATASGHGAAEFRRFVAERVAAGLTPRREPTLAWFEIVLDGARHPDGRVLARTWYDAMTAAWEQCARSFGLADPQTAARSALDLTAGALIHALALRLDGGVMGALVRGEADAAEHIRGRGDGPGEAQPSGSGRSQATRDRILEAALELLASQGAGAVKYASVAQATGLTASAVAYHFTGPDAVLAEAQALLFTRCQQRFSEMLSAAFRGGDLARLFALAPTILDVEAVEHRDLNLANYAIWVEAARRPELSAVVQETLAVLYGAWVRMLVRLGAALDATEGLMVQCGFIGGLIRTIACGSTPDAVQTTSAKLSADLAAFADRSHWAQAR